MQSQDIKQAVRERYGGVAKENTSCCGSGSQAAARQASKSVGYSDDEMAAVPEGANLGLGCGNPVAIASLKKGETVIDLGSGGGFDCFLAARQVGQSGRVIGVDMTSEMLDLARANVARSQTLNVEFRLGEIENLPVADGTADVIISNCVINLSPDKPRVFREAYRALKPGGRIMVSDMVLLEELPPVIRNSLDAYARCVGGASLKSAYLAAITAAGFHDVKVVGESFFSEEMAEDMLKPNPLDDVPVEVARQAAHSVVSIRVQAYKPA